MQQARCNNYTPTKHREKDIQPEAERKLNLQIHQHPEAHMTKTLFTLSNQQDEKKLAIVKKKPVNSKH